MIPTLPASFYVSPLAFQWEMRALFPQTPQVAAHLSELPEVGAYATVVAGLEVVLTRDALGQVRAFPNVCRHRAGPLVWPHTAGAGDALTCRYHGWRYGLDGALVATPQFGEAVDPAQRCLPPLPVWVIEGVVFVQTSPALPQKTVDQVVSGGTAPPAEALTGLPLSGMRAFARTVHPLQANWKTYVENYLEGYHIPHLHPSLNREIHMRDYLVEVADHYAIHRVPTRDGALVQGRWVWIWPNTAINFYGLGANIERMVPVGPSQMEIRYTWLIAQEADEAAAEASRAMSLTVTDEDIAICEAVQRNLAQGSYTQGQLSPRHEQAVAAFQRWVGELHGLDPAGR